MFFNKIGKNNKKRVSVYFSPEEWSSDTHSKRLNSFVDGLSSDYEYKMIPYYTDYKKTEYIFICLYIVIIFGMIAFIISHKNLF